MPLTSFLHRNPKSNVLPLPPLDPPPSVEKRQEKEKAWLASIYDRKGKAPSKADNKDAKVLGYTAPAPSSAGQRNHARSRTADSVLPSTSSVGGKSSASVKSGLLTISSRWRQSSSRPASVIGSDGPNDTLEQRNIAMLQVPSSGSPQHQQPPAVPSSSSASSPSLAQRLEQLSKAHSQGLLDDEEYRVLRGNLFENSLRKVPLSQHNTSAPSHEIGQKELLNAVREDGVERTGTLLGLPRLLPIHNSMLGSTNLSRANNNLTIPSDALKYSLALPSSADSIRSTRTCSKLSVRSSKSAFSLRSRITSLLPSSTRQQNALEEVIQPFKMNADATDQAHPHLEQAETTLKRKPSFLDAAKSAMTFKTEQQQNTRAALPTEWTTSNGDHLADSSAASSSSISVTSRRSSHLSVSGISSSSASYSSVRNSFQPIEAFTSASAEKGASSSLLPVDKANSASGEYLKDSRARKSIGEDYANHSFSTLSSLHLIPTSLIRPRSSTLLSSSSTGHHLPSSPTSSNTHDAHLKFSVMQAEDELLDAEGLRKAIQKVELEKKNVSEQFAQLQKDMSANLGRSGHDASLLSSPTRAASPRRHAGSGKRSLGSSSSSSIQGGESTFRQSLNIPSGLPASLSRRPSLANSVQSHQSTSSSLLSPSSSSRLRPLHLPYEVEDEEVVLSLPMSPATRSKKGRHRLEGSSDSTESMEGDDKLARLEEKRRNVEMRYDARLEYLHAKLVARELKEKLRR